MIKGHSGFPERPFLLGTAVLKFLTYAKREVILPYSLNKAGRASGYNYPLYGHIRRQPGL
jgi:hypothetical protein